MSGATITRRASARAKGAVPGGIVVGLGLAGAGVWLVAVSFVSAATPANDASVRGLLTALVVGLPIAAGLYALQVPSNERFGLMLIAAGFAWSLTALAESQDSVPYTIGRVAGWLVFPGLIYLTLAFPQGRIEPGLDRRVCFALNLVLVVLFIGSAPFVEAYPDHTPWATCSTDCPANALFVLDQEPRVMSAVIGPLREGLASVLFLLALGSTVRRLRAATTLQRTAYLPVMLMTAVSSLVLIGFFIVRRMDALNSAADTLGLLWGACVAAIAAAFFVGLLHRRLQLGHVLADLAERLSHAPDLPRVRDALAGAVSDPTLELLVPEGPVRWRDSTGTYRSLPGPERGRMVTIVGESDVNPVAALVHDNALRADPELLGAVGALAQATMHQHIVATRLAGALRQLEQSRRRIAEAADVERARIERDLHDGAQQRLMTLRIRLSLAEELLQSDPRAGAAAVAELGDEIDRTLDELRALAHGVYPAILSDRGLEDALRSLALGATIPVHVQTRGLTRQHTEVETAVYFTCAEALQNALKHAHGASAVWVDLRQTNVLTLRVRDDGPGFTPPVDQLVDGHDGLRNMRDRLEAVGGRLTIDSSPGHGTRVIGVVPLD